MKCHALELSLRWSAFVSSLFQQSILQFLVYLCLLPCRNQLGANFLCSTNAVPNTEFFLYRQVRSRTSEVSPSESLSGCCVSVFFCHPVPYRYVFLFCFGFFGREFGTMPPLRLSHSSDAFKFHQFIWSIFWMTLVLTKILWIAPVHRISSFMVLQVLFLCNVVRSRTCAYLFICVFLRKIRTQSHIVTRMGQCVFMFILMYFKSMSEDRSCL